jgi:hypothetical protein
VSSPQANKSFTIRSAAILTTGAVNGTDFVVNKAWASKFSLDIRFTLGSLTNVTLLWYVSMDQSTYVPVESLSGGVVTLVPTASVTKSMPFDCSGWSYFRVSAQGSGTTTSSSLTLTARYMSRAT